MTISKIAEPYGIEVRWNKLEKYFPIKQGSWTANTIFETIAVPACDFRRLCEDKENPTTDDIVTLFHEIGHIYLGHHTPDSLANNEIFLYRNECEAWGFAISKSIEYNISIENIMSITIDALKSYGKCISTNVKNIIQERYLKEAKYNYDN